MLVFIELSYCRQKLQVVKLFNLELLVKARKNHENTVIYGKVLKNLFTCVKIDLTRSFQTSGQRQGPGQKF